MDFGVLIFWWGGNVLRFGRPPSGSAHRPLIASLKRDWASGEIAAKKVQEYAMGAAAQGADDLDKLASLGAHGRYQNNIQRDLLQVFGTPKGARALDWINIPGKNGKLMRQPFIMPHKNIFFPI